MNQEADAPNLGDYLGIFQRHLGLILGLTLALLILGGVVAYLIPEQFESTTRVKVQDPGVQSDLVGLSQVMVPHKPFLTSIQLDIKNRTFLEPILKEIGLTEGYNVRDPQDLNDLYEYLFENLIVTIKLNRVGTDQLAITYTGRDAHKVMQFVNKVRDRYIEIFKGEFKDEIYSLHNSMRVSVAEIGRKHANSIAAYQSFKEENKSLLSGNNADRHRLRIKLQSDRADLRRSIRTAESELERIRGQLAKEQETFETTTLIPNPEIILRRTELSKMQALLQSYLDKNFTEKMNVVKEVRGRMAAHEILIAGLDPSTESSRTIDRNPIYSDLVQTQYELSRQLDSSQFALNSLTKELTAIEKSIGLVPVVERSLEELLVEQELTGDTLRLLQLDADRIKRTWENISGKGSDLFVVASWPRSDGDPVFPSVPLFVFIGGAIGLLVGIGVAFVREFSGLVFATAMQVQSSLPVMVVGEVAAITTHAERQAILRRRLRRWAIASIVVLLLVTLHALYLNEEWTQYLPPDLVSVMDKIYQGG